MSNGYASSKITRFQVPPGHDCGKFPIKPRKFPHLIYFSALMAKATMLIEFAGGFIEVVTKVIADK